MEHTPGKAPPSGNFIAPIVHHIQSLYKEIYSIGKKLSKADKLGIHKNIEEICLKILSDSIKASLRANKSTAIRKIRVGTETLKHLIRIESELNIISSKQCVLLQEKLQEISKEALGWERYIHKSSPQRELL